MLNKSLYNLKKRKEIMIKKKNEQGIKEKGKRLEWTTPHFHTGCQPVVASKLNV